MGTPNCCREHAEQNLLSTRVPLGRQLCVVDLMEVCDGALSMNAAAALDVHKRQVTACVHVPDQQRERAELCAEFETMTADLLGLRDWLKGLGVTHVAMEATGVYWKPSTTCSRTTSSCCSSMRSTSRTCRAARPTCRTRSGSASCSSTACCGRASCRRSPNPRAARPHPLSQVPGVGARARSQPAAEGARGRQHQAPPRSPRDHSALQARRCSKSCARATTIPPRSLTSRKGSCTQSFPSFAGRSTGASRGLSRALGLPPARPYRVPGSTSLAL